MLSQNSPLLRSGSFSPMTTSMTPRSRATRTASWLAVIAIVVSSAALLSATFDMPYGLWKSRRQVVVKSILLTARGSKLLYQSKPLLVDEEELDEVDMDYIREEQVSKEAKALALLHGVEQRRAEIVLQLLKEARSARDGVQARLRGKWAPAQTRGFVEELPEETYEGEYDSAGGAVFGSEDVETEGRSTAGRDDDEDEGVSDDYATELEDEVEDLDEEEEEAGAEDTELLGGLRWDTAAEADGGEGSVSTADADAVALGLADHAPQRAALEEDAAQSTRQGEAEDDDALEPL